MSAEKEEVNAALSCLMSENQGRLLSVLIANLRDFQMAEDCLQEALTSAISHWNRSGIPDNPSGWILQAARRKAIDKFRRVKNFDLKSKEYGYLVKLDEESVQKTAGEEIPDDRLRLIFTCCHPALDSKTHVALTLRTLGGLTTEEIAHAFLDSEAAMAQRMVRARHKIKKAGIPYSVPQADAFSSRLQSVLTVIYLIFNEGYSATTGEKQVRVDLCEEAIFLARLVNNLMPDLAETEGLLGLMLLVHSRRRSRLGSDETPVALEDQDRTKWEIAMINEGLELVEVALGRRDFGPFQVKAAIQAVHAEASNFGETRWGEILGLYDVLLQYENTAVVRLNRAVALSYIDGPEVALLQVESLRQELNGYHSYHAARAEFLRRMQRYQEADSEYQTAIEICTNDSAKAFLKSKRLATKKEAEQKLGLSPTGR